MYERELNKYAIKQIAYVVEDLEGAARDHSALFGSGPFVYMPTMTPAEASWNGAPVELHLDEAYGAYGNTQIELIEMPKTGDKTIFDKIGFHHFAIWADDIDEALEDFANEGCFPVLTMASAQGLVINFIDCREKWGHFIELYTPQTGLDGMTRGLAQAWDGNNPYLSIADLKR